MKTERYFLMTVIYPNNTCLEYGYAYMLLDKIDEIEIYDLFDIERYKNDEINLEYYLIKKAKISMVVAEYLINKIIEENIEDIEKKKELINTYLKKI